MGLVMRDGTHSSGDILDRHFVLWLWGFGARNRARLRHGPRVAGTRVRQCRFSRWRYLIVCRSTLTTALIRGWVGLLIFRIAYQTDRFRSAV